LDARSLPLLHRPIKISHGLGGWIGVGVDILAQISKQEMESGVLRASARIDVDPSLDEHWDDFAIIGCCQVEATILLLGNMSSRTELADPHIGKQRKIRPAIQEQSDKSDVAIQTSDMERCHRFLSGKGRVTITRLMTGGLTHIVPAVDEGPAIQEQHNTCK
jgi:hypothetical protein